LPLRWRRVRELLREQRIEVARPGRRFIACAVDRDEDATDICS
jgi:hypothetical protein